MKAEEQDKEWEELVMLKMLTMVEPTVTEKILCGKHSSECLQLFIYSIPTMPVMSSLCKSHMPKKT
jgi:hypothetical protein